MLYTIKQAYPNASFINYDGTFNDGTEVKLNDERGRELDLDYDWHYGCKVWNAHPDLAIVAFKAEAEFDSETSEYPMEEDLELFIVSLKDKKIVAHFVEKESVPNDADAAMRFESLKIDTAKYKLNKSTVAFGLRVITDLKTRSQRGRNEAISLYVYENGTIKKLLDNFSVSGDSGELFDGFCTGNFGRHEDVIIVNEKQVSNGLYSLIVKSNYESFIVYNKKNNDCIERVLGKGVNIKSLIFNGTTYESFDGSEDDYISYGFLD